MGEKSWVIKVNDEVKKLTDITGVEKKAWERHSIYKLPACVTDLVTDLDTDKSNTVYKPRAISFGPYHYGELNLKPMEAHKERALRHFLKRSRKPLERYVDALKEFVPDLKGAYDSLEDYWQQNSDAFLQLMIRDGCFMLEVLRTTSFTDHHTHDDYAPNDPIFSTHGQLNMLPYIKRDMLMLENQLPMLLLRKLHDVYKEFAIHRTEGEESIDKQIDILTEGEESMSIDTQIAKFYFHSISPTNLDKCLHVLDIYRTTMIGKDRDSTQYQKPSETCNRGGDDDIFSAMELDEAGIRIKKSNSPSLRDVQFDRHRGILRLPKIVVDDVSETMFLNLIAFERFHAGAGNEVTDYIYFMDKLIDNARDVNILQNREIIQNAIGSDKAVAKLFNSLSKDVALDPGSSLTEVRQWINSYCKTKWHRWRATLIHTYFRNPWAIVSVIAAIFLFALTIVQAVYGALQYYQGNN